MKRTGVSLMAAVALAVLPLPVAAEPLATWDTVINGPGRFRVLQSFQSAAVLDRETGLVWALSPGTATRDWLGAHRLGNDRTVGNGSRKGWRLPTVQEIASLVDATQDFPALPGGHPFRNVQSELYWSVTTFGADLTQAWGADFGGLIGGGARFTSKNLPNLVWCVRSGHRGPDVQ